MGNVVTNILAESTKTADFTTDWFDIIEDGSRPRAFFTVQGYWKSMTGAGDGTIDVDLCINKTKADSDDAYGTATGTTTTSTAAGGFDFQVDNRGGNKYFRLRYTEEANTSIALYADCNSVDV